MDVFYVHVCYFTCIFYAVVRQISILFINSKDSVFCKSVKTLATNLFYFSSQLRWATNQS